MDTSATFPEIDETVLATTRYLQALTTLDEDSAGRPSLLPGWSRGYVVAHLSRNADGFTRVLSQLSAGEPASMYSSNDDRDRDIAETVRTHDLAALVEDARASADRMARAVATYGGDDGATYGRTPADPPQIPVQKVGPLRRAEVEIHHADLDLGYAPADWPSDFAVGLVTRRQDELAGLGSDCPSMVLSSTDVEGRWEIGEGPGPEVHGAVGDLAYWLVGRAGGRGLTTSSGELPTLGRWR